MNNKPINQNGDRYIIGDGEWKVEASKEVKPLRFRFGKPLTDLKPLLDSDGIIVDIGDSLLCSQSTLDTIKGMKNPHYDVLSNGSIRVGEKDVVIGKTIPIIKIDVSKLRDIGVSRELSNSKGGVKEVEYIYDTEKVMGVPKGIIDQINWTLVDGIERPSDGFSYWKWVKDGDTKYSIDSLKIVTAQEDGKFDRGKLSEFLVGIKSRLNLLNKDFNSIKRTFFYGEVPSAEGISLEVLRGVVSKPEDDIINHQYVEKNSSIVSVLPTPSEKGITSTQKKIDSVTEQLTTEIQRQSSQIKEELESAQQSDSVQQQSLREDLNRQISRTEAFYKEKYGSKK